MSASWRDTVAAEAHDSLAGMVRPQWLVVSSCGWDDSLIRSAVLTHTNPSSIVSYEHLDPRETWRHASQARRPGRGPPLKTYTPAEIETMAVQSRALGHSPRIGMAMTAVIAGHRAANAAPLEAPRMLTARP